MPANKGMHYSVTSVRHQGSGTQTHTAVLNKRWKEDFPHHAGLSVHPSGLLQHFRL